MKLKLSVEISADTKEGLGMALQQMEKHVRTNRHLLDGSSEMHCWGIGNAVIQWRIVEENLIESLGREEKIEIKEKENSGESISINPPTNGKSLFTSRPCPIHGGNCSILGSFQIGLTQLWKEMLGSIKPMARKDLRNCLEGEGKSEERPSSCL